MTTRHGRVLCQPKSSHAFIPYTMNIEDVRAYALSLNAQVTEELFAEQWISWKIAGKWFLLMQLDTPEPKIAVKLKPETGTALREQYDGVRPAYHMNKTHWNDLYINLLDDDFVQEQIRASYDLVVSKLPAQTRKSLSQAQSS